MSIRHPDILDECMRIIDIGDTSFLSYHAGGSDLASINNDRRSWGVSEHRCYAGVPHNNANRKKKAKRKQAQASRRNNRR